MKPDLLTKRMSDLPVGGARPSTALVSRSRKYLEDLYTKYIKHTVYTNLATSNFLSSLSSPRTISVKHTEQIIWIEHVLFGSNFTTSNCIILTARCVLIKIKTVR